MKTLYLVMRMKTKMLVSVFGEVVSVPLSSTADGCAGCMLLFNSKEAAFEYSGDAKVVELEVGNAE